MSYVMRLTEEIDKVRLIQLAANGEQPEWMYLRTFDPDGEGGRGFVRLTGNLDKAKRFDSLEAVFEEWKRQSSKVPYRPDGRPNRPLTAFTMEPFEVPD